MAKTATLHNTDQDWSVISNFLQNLSPLVLCRSILRQFHCGARRLCVCPFAIRTALVRCHVCACDTCAVRASYCLMLGAVLHRAVGIHTRACCTLTVRALTLAGSAAHCACFLFDGSPSLVMFWRARLFQGVGVQDSSLLALATHPLGLSVSMGYLSRATSVSGCPQERVKLRSEIGSYAVFLTGCISWEELKRVPPLSFCHYWKGWNTAFLSPWNPQHLGTISATFRCSDRFRYRFRGGRRKSRVYLACFPIRRFGSRAFLEI